MLICNVTFRSVEEHLENCFSFVRGTLRLFVLKIALFLRSISEYPKWSGDRPILDLRDKFFLIQNFNFLHVMTLVVKIDVGLKLLVPLMLMWLLPCQAPVHCFSFILLKWTGAWQRRHSYPNGSHRPKLWQIGMIRHTPLKRRSQPPSSTSPRVWYCMVRELSENDRCRTCGTLRLS
jgi:hypothetical protein